MGRNSSEVDITPALTGASTGLWAAGVGGKILVAMTLALACLSLIILGLRVDTVVRYGNLFTTSGTEGSNIYAVWKLHHGAPLFEWPDRAPYAFTPYNFLFYYVFAGVTWVGSAFDGQMMLVGRLLALAFAFVGAVLQWILMIDLLRLPKGRCWAKVFLAAIAMIAWLGSGFMSWWVLTFRPDIGAAALTTLGLILYMKGIRRTTLSMLLAASVVFFLAWGFRQVTVWTLAGLGFHVLFFRRNIREILAFLAPCAVLMAAALVIGGAVLRYNVIVAQSINAIYFMQILTLGALAIAPNLYFWLFPLAAAFFPPRRVDPEGRKVFFHNPLFAGLEPVVVVAVAAMFFGSIALGREGASRNHILEAFIACSVIAGVVGVRVLAMPRSGRRGLLVLAANGLLLTMLGFTAVQLALPNRFGKLRFEKSEVERRQALVSFADSLPKPMWTEDEVLCLPWHATGDKYPAYPLIGAYYDTARERHMLKDGGIEAMIQRGEFRSLLLESDSHYYQVAVEAGYKPMPLPVELKNNALQVLVPPVSAATRGEQP